MEITKKSPNRLWKESGTSLSFADWIEREKGKGVFLRNKKFENFANAEGVIDDASWLAQVQEQDRIDLGIDKPIDLNKNDVTFLGLSKPVLILSGLLILGAIGYKLYQKRKVA